MKRLAKKSQQKQQAYVRRKHRTNVITKASGKPRLIVNKSNRFIYAQIVAPDGKVLASAHDMKLTTGTKSERAFLVGETLAKNATNNKVTDVVFDRNGFLFHGRIKQLAEGARKGGLQF